MHIDSTVHWCTHGCDHIIMLIEEILECLANPWTFYITLIKTFEFHVVLAWTHWYRDFTDVERWYG